MLRYSRCLLILLLFLTACKLQTENSSVNDEDIYGFSGTGSVEYRAARSVLSKKCAGCHNYSSMTEAEMLAAGLIVQGSAVASKIYYRLAGSTGGGGPKNMPVSSTLSSTDVNTIYVWIQNL